MKTIQFYLGALVISASAIFAACKSAPAQPGNGGAKMGQAPGPQTQQMQPPAGCSNLTPDEQNFAYQLTMPGNQSMFCNQFTSDQRTQAMQMAGQPMAGGAAMSADQAVQQVMQNNKMTPMQPSSSSSGACPVK